MTRDELIAELTKRATACGEIRTRHDESGAIERLHGKAAAYAHAAELAEQLDSPPAMAWQDEPTRWGWHYVDGIGVRDLRKLRDGTWVCKRHGGDKKLNGRRVCPIPAAPPRPKRGDK